MSSCRCCRGCPASRLPFCFCLSSFLWHWKIDSVQGTINGSSPGPGRIRIGLVYNSIDRPIFSHSLPLAVVFMPLGPLAGLAVILIASIFRGNFFTTNNGNIKQENCTGHFMHRSCQEQTQRLSSEVVKIRAVIGFGEVISVSSAIFGYLKEII